MSKVLIDKKVIEQALEALKEVRDAGIPRLKFKSEYHQTITALRSALAESVEQGAEWTPCVKLPVTVHVRKQRDGETHVSTREGITPVKHDDLIMRGVSGEEYPIGREIFEQTYRIGDAHPTPAVPDTNAALIIEHHETTIARMKEALEMARIALSPGAYWNDGAIALAKIKEVLNK